MHLKRWITAGIALPLLIFLICKGGAFFSVLVAIVCLLTLSEYFRIVFNPKGKTISGIVLVSGFFSGLFMIWSAHRGSFETLLSIMALNLILCGLFSTTQFKSDPFLLENIAKQIQGITYIPLSLSFLVLIRNDVDGMAWVFLIIFVIFAGDTGAYYVGSYFGKHKLCPSISPGKTVEGALGGLAANLVIGVIFKCFVFPIAPWHISIAFFLALGAAGQVGDLFESELKRVAHIKDSGFVMPGHGGMLDRIDAILFAAPVAYIFKNLIL